VSNLIVHSLIIIARIIRVNSLLSFNRSRWSRFWAKRYWHLRRLNSRVHLLVFIVDQLTWGVLSLYHILFALFLAIVVSIVGGLILWVDQPRLDHRLRVWQINVLALAHVGKLIKLLRLLENHGLRVCIVIVFYFLNEQSFYLVIFYFRKLFVCRLFSVFMIREII